MKHSLACLALLLAACGGSGTGDQPPDAAATSDDAPPMPGADAGVDAPPAMSTGTPPIRAIVSGAKRLTGPNGLVVDVEVGHALDQGVRTSGSIIVRGGAASFD